MMRKKLLQISISALLALSLLAGCGSAPAEEEEVELIEPVGVTADYAVVTRRDLQTVKILNGKVVPKVSEVTFSGGQNFKKYGNMPGMNVRAGDVIVYGSTESIDNQIKDLQEQIDAASEDMTDYLSETNKQLAEYIQHEKNCADVMDSFDGMTEEERENYENYDSEYEKYRRIYQQATAQREKCEQELKKKTELYALDSEYNQKKLRRLQKKREEVLALAPVDGNLVAINYFDENSWVAKETPVGAVGDLNALELKTDQVFESEVKRAEDVFAIVNGKRYEVEFKKSESAAASEGETASADGYATFLMDDPAHEVKAGDFGIVVLIAFIVLVTSLINLVRVLVRGRTENIGPLPSDTVVVHKVPIYYDYSQQVPEASPVSDSYFSDALFVGDTRVQCLDLYGVGNFQTLLYGTSIDVTTALSYSCKSSDGTDGTLNDKVSLNQYGKIYINLGMNELGWSNPDTFATNYRLLVEELKIKQPNAVIYICGIMPVSLNRDGRVSYITNDRIQKYNTLLRTVATDTQVYYLDCYDGIADEEGYLPSEQTSDGINLLEEGCQVWYNYLKTHTVNPEDYSN